MIVQGGNAFLLEQGNSGKALAPEKNPQDFQDFLVSAKRKKSLPSHSDEKKAPSLKNKRDEDYGDTSEVPVERRPLAKKKSDEVSSGRAQEDTSRKGPEHLKKISRENTRAHTKNVQTKINEKRDAQSSNRSESYPNTLIENTEKSLEMDFVPKSMNSDLGEGANKDLSLLGVVQSTEPHNQELQPIFQGMNQKNRENTEFIFDSMRSQIGSVASPSFSGLKITQREDVNQKVIQGHFLGENQGTLEVPSSSFEASMLGSKAEDSKDSSLLRSLHSTQSSGETVGKNILNQTQPKGEESMSVVESMGVDSESMSQKVFAKSEDNPKTKTGSAQVNADIFGEDQKNIEDMTKELQPKVLGLKNMISKASEKARLSDAVEVKSKIDGGNQRSINLGEEWVSTDELEVTSLDGSEQFKVLNKETPDITVEEKVDDSGFSIQTLLNQQQEQDSQVVLDQPATFADQVEQAEGPGEKVGNMQSIIKQARTIVDDGGGSMEIHLQPESLGKVHLKVAVQDGVVNVEMLADNIAAKRALEEGLLDVKQALEGQKLLVETLKVEMSQDYQKDFSDLENYMQEQANREFAQQFLGEFRQNREQKMSGLFDSFRNFERAPSEPELTLNRNPYTEKGKGRSINLVV